MCERQRRLSQPYITRGQNQSALIRRQTVHAQKPLLVKEDSKVQHVIKKLSCFYEPQILTFRLIFWREEIEEPV